MKRLSPIFAVVAVILIGSVLLSLRPRFRTSLWQNIPPLRSAITPQPYPRAGTAVLGLAFSPDGKTLAANEDQAMVRLWDVSTLHPLLATHEVEGSDVVSVSWPPMEKTIAVSDETGIRFFDAKTLLYRRMLAEKSPSRSLFGTRTGVRVLSGDGKLATVGETDGRITGWDVPTGKRLFVVPSPSVRNQGCPTSLCGLCLSPDSLLLATASLVGDNCIARGDIEISLRDSHTGHFIRSWPWTNSGILKVASFGWNLGNAGMAFSPDGKTLATSGTQETALWDVQTGRLLQRLIAGTVQSQGRRALAFTPAKPLLVSVGDGPDMRVWDIRTGKLVRVFHGPPVVTALAVSPDGSLLATGGQDAKAHGVLQLWNLKGL
jgi:WD40 repeat protein